MKIHGTVIKAIGSPKPHDFLIQDDNGEKYFAHLGDLQNNEDKLYDKIKETEFLEIGDEVEFDPVKSEKARAIHVKKIH
jgi:cold shock CspA family protein